MRKILNALLCLSIAFSLAVIGFAQTDHACSKDCTQDQSFKEFLGGVSEAELKAAAEGLNPGERTVLSNGAVFIRAIEQLRVACPSCKRSGATYMGIERKCEKRFDGYCNTSDKHFYECASCGIVEGGTTNTVKHHKIYSSECTL